MGKRKNLIQLLNRMLEIPRPIKRGVCVTLDAILLLAAYLAAKALRLGSLNFPSTLEEWSVISTTIAVSIYIFARTGLYRAILRHLAPQAMTTVMLGVLSSTITLVALSFFLRAGIPRTVPVIYAAIALIAIGGTRYMVRSIIIGMQRWQKQKVIIYGAGNAGSQLASALHFGQEYEAVAFIDDNPQLHGNTVQGLTVYAPNLLHTLILRYAPSKILLAMPSASHERRRKILRQLEPFPVKVQTVAGISDLVSGKATVAELRDIDVEDLLGRDPIAPSTELMSKNIEGRVVLVSGAGGTIGSELCRQLIQYGPAKLVLLEQSEYALYNIHRELRHTLIKEDLDIETIGVLGNTQNRRHALNILKKHKVCTIYHAAAYKHVPILEDNICEGVQNNVFGTWHLAQAAVEAKVETFVLISSDKAVRPTNLMGASKRLAELCLQALAQEQQSTRFINVRFGNVLGSSGSVVPLFKEQISRGGPVTVTHPEVVRYFMTIPEAAQLVIQAGALGSGGEVFVLDMGEPVKIADLAKQMIHLYGFKEKDDNNPSGDIAIIYSGLRPGEKLYEELLIGNNVVGTVHPRIMKAREISLSFAELQKALDSLKSFCALIDEAGISKLMQDLPLGYSGQELALQIRQSEQTSVMQSG